MGKREGLIEWMQEADQGGGAATEGAEWAEKWVDRVITEALRDVVSRARGLRYSQAHDEEWMGYDHQEDAWVGGYEDALDVIDPDVHPEFLQPGYKSSWKIAEEFVASLKLGDR